MTFKPPFMSLLLTLSLIFNATAFNYASQLYDVSISSGGYPDFPPTVITDKNSTSPYATSKNAFKYPLNGQCTWYAYGRVIELAEAGYLDSSAITLMHNAFWDKTGRDARNWPNSNFLGGEWTSTISAPLPMDKRRPGMLAVWKPNYDNPGHVGFVEEVSADKTKYRLSDFNYRFEAYRTVWYSYEGGSDLILGTYPSFYQLPLPASASCSNGSSANYRNILGGPPIHPNGTLIKEAGNPLVYLLEGGRKRPVYVSRDQLQHLYPNGGFDYDDIVTVSSDELALYQNGDDVTGQLPSNGKGKPDGTLIKDPNGQGISIVTDNGDRRPFASGYLELGYAYCKAAQPASDYYAYPEGAIAGAMPLVTTSLRLSPSSPYFTGNTLNGSFTITNVGRESITFNHLLIGGRLNSNVSDFDTDRPMTLAAGQAFTYNGTKNLTAAGDYIFYVAYQDNAGHWTTYTPANPGVIAAVGISVSAPATCPSVSGISPASGQAGNSVVITGNNFSGVTSVKFANNMAAVFAINSNTQITAIVPSGATNGPITLSKSGCGDAQTGTFTVTAASSTPNPPILNGATNVSTTGATLSWSGVSGATEYRVQVSTSPTFNTSADGRDCFNCVAGGNQVISAPTTNFSLSGLAAGTAYYWHVRAGRSVTTPEWTTNWSSNGAFTTTTAMPTPTPSPTPSPSPVPTPTPTPTPVLKTIQFGAPSYSVGESNGHATISVTRSGDVSSAASVNYATSDSAGVVDCSVTNGIASERCDYATTLGTLNFAAGQASAAFQIPITDDSHAEGAETFTVSLSNVAGATLGSPYTATVNIVDNDQAGNQTKPIDNVGFFVRQQYLDFFSREPDSIGLSGWTATMNQCPNGGYGEFDHPECDRVHVSAGFYQSTEFQGRGYFVYRFYQVGLGRRPTYKEFVPDMARVGGSQSPEQEAASKVYYINEFVQRAEFAAKYNQPQFADPAAYVKELERVAGVSVSNEAQLIADLRSGTKTRAEVLRVIAESQEVFHKYYNQAFVAMQYFGYLRRDPDTNGFANWVQTLDTSGNYRHMIFGFIYSAEYRGRFGRP